MELAAWNRCFGTKAGPAGLGRVMFLLGLVIVGSGTARADWRPSPQEMAMLPPYCAARFDEKSPAFARWKSILGQDFIHIHHYCAGLNFIQRATAQFSRKDREGTLGAAVREMDYVLTHAQPDFSMRPEILTSRATALSLLGKDGEAAVNLETAIQLNPKFSGAYRSLADLQVKLHQRERALETVTAGLQNIPDDRGLQRRYDQLGGKKPYPAPLEKAQAAPAPAQSAEQLAPGDLAAKRATGSDGSESAAAERAESAADRAASTSAPPNAAKQANPWCRFCPDDDPAPAPAPSTPPAEPTAPR